MRRTLSAVLAALSLTFVIGACSKKGEQVEDKIVDEIKKAYNLSDVKVTCPGDVKADKGTNITCTATGDFTDAVKSDFGLDPTDDVKVDTVKIDVNFVADNSFEASFDNADVESQLSDQLGLTEN
ncbi:MAG: DUF4333 domain-containing protein [Acidimicrobiales bacterium]